MLSAVFLWQLFDEQSFFSAIRGVELRKLSHKPGDGDGPTWENVYNDFENVLKALPCLRPHFAAKQALASVIRAEHGRQPASELLPVIGQCREIDPGNWIVRLSQACLADKARPPATNDAATTQARFAAMKQIIEAAPPPDKSTLYNQELTGAWHTVLQRYIKRADVAANVATGEQDPRIFVVEHYEALPMIQRRLFELSQALRIAGRLKEADECIRWLAATTLGLMQADKDAGTRLLCADLRSRSWKTGEMDSLSLRFLREDFHASAAGSPIDLTDLPIKRPTPAPREFRRVLLAAGAALFFGLFGFGCGAAIIAAMLAQFCREHLFRRAASDPDLASAAKKIGPVGILGTSAAFVLAVGCAVGYFGWFSESCLLVRVFLLMALGALFAILRSGLAQEFSRSDSTRNGSLAPNRRSFRLWSAAIAILLFFAGCVSIVPSAELATNTRYVDLSMGPVVVLIPALLGALVVIAGATARVPIHTVMRTSLAALCLTMFAAVLILQYERRADTSLIRATVAGRLDELSAQLGRRWDEYVVQEIRYAGQRP